MERKRSDLPSSVSKLEKKFEALTAKEEEDLVSNPHNDFPSSGSKLVAKFEALATKEEEDLILNPYNEQINLQYFLSNICPVSETIFKYLSWKELLTLHDTSSTTRDSVASYVGRLRHIDVREGQFKRMDYNCLRVLIPYTKMLRTLTVHDIGSAELTDVVRANSNFRRVHVLFEQRTTLNATLDTWTQSVQSVEEISIQYDDGFAEIGPSFTRFVNKFQNLSKLEIVSKHISQDWLNEIGEKCSKLVALKLTEYSAIPKNSGNETQQPIGNATVDFSGILKKNKKLLDVRLHLYRNITQEFCRQLSTNMKLIRLELPRYAPMEDFYRILAARFDNVTSERQPGGRIMITKT